MRALTGLVCSRVPSLQTRILAYGRFAAQSELFADAVCTQVMCGVFSMVEKLPTAMAEAMTPTGTCVCALSAFCGRAPSLQTRAGACRRSRAQSELFPVLVCVQVLRWLSDLAQKMPQQVTEGRARSGECWHEGVV